MRLIQLVSLAALMLAHGTALIAITWIATVTVMRRSRPALIAVAWTVVLLKFLVPPVLPTTFGYSSMLRFLAAKTEQSIVAPSNESQHLDDRDSQFTRPADRAREGTPFHWLVVALVVIYWSLLTLLIARSVSHMRRLSRHVRSLPDARIELWNEVSALAAKVGLRRTPRLKIDNAAATPFVTGLWHPTVVVPENLLADLQVEVRRALLIHELAHIRRADVLIRWVQNVARLLFFFWPPIWWVCRRLERYAEIACDEWALRLSAAGPEAYAEALLVIARGVRARPGHACELGLSSTVATMTARFERILRNTDRRSSPGLPWIVFPAILSWTIFVLSGSGFSYSAPNSVPATTVPAIAKNTLNQDRGVGQEVHQESRMAKRKAEERRAAESAAQRRKAEDSQTTAPGRPADSTFDDRNKTSKIDLNGDGVVSDFEAGYSAAQTFIVSRNRREGDDERRMEIERREQEKVALRNRPPNNR